jgi:flagellar P-ring protein precursor FlgI
MFLTHSNPSEKRGSRRPAPARQAAGAQRLRSALIGWMRRALAGWVACILFASAALGSTARLKDLVMVYGANDNQLVGLGLVAGLAGDGDKNPIYTVQNMANMVQRFGMNIPASAMQSKNVATVVVTADLPSYAKVGWRLNVTIASIGDAKSLQGAVLIDTPLQGADGKTYAIAQGPISVGGFSAGTGGGGGATVTKNHPTVATIPSGAMVVKEIPATIVRENTLELILRDPDFTSAARLATAINETFPGLASAVDNMSVRVRLPEGMTNSPVEFISRLEPIEVTPDTTAKIIINERTGTIVANSRIRIARCAVSHGNLTINIASTLNVSQPSSLSQTGTTTVTPSTNTKVTEPKSALIPLEEMPSIESVAKALNSLGVTPRDMMAIFQQMKEAGVLQAELLLR